MTDMLQKSENVAKNVANKNSQHLTEQWKKGKLPIGWYYIKIVDIVFIDFFEGKVWKNKKDKYVDEVIAEVPSYDGYMTLIRAYNDVVDENTKLKELLKECIEPLEVLADKRNSCDWYPEDLLAKIDEVLK